MKDKVAVFWFRRDLRLDDNAALYQALAAGVQVVPLFIFDRHILDQLEEKDDARVTFLHRRVSKLKEQLEKLYSCGLEVLHDYPDMAWKTILSKYNVTSVYTNRDYEPYATTRDKKIKDVLAEAEIPFNTYKDHVIFEEHEVQKKTGGTYTVFTPYSRTWKSKLDEKKVTDAAGNAVSVYLNSYPVAQYVSAFAKTAYVPPPEKFPSLEDMGFSESTQKYPGQATDEDIIESYDKTRDFPALKGTTRLGLHLRFGTISIRKLARRALHLNEVYLSELIWRDFYAQVLQAFPQVVHTSFRPEYDEIEWVNNEEHFEAWCKGKTGYPMVDAGMRELNQTGYMHNRVRMVVASFLTKHLLTDWRWGERYFAKKLLDFDLASNNGGWQWAAGCGTDAAPYFRVFNPESQLKKFDKNLDYIKKWVPEYGTTQYPAPIVEHKVARQRALDTYKAGLAKARG